MITPSNRAIIAIDGQEYLSGQTAQLVIQDITKLKEEDLKLGLKIFFSTVQHSFKPVQVRVLLPQRSWQVFNILSLKAITTGSSSQPKDAQLKALSNQIIARKIAAFCPKEMALSYRRFYSDPVIFKDFQLEQLNDLEKKGVLSGTLSDAVLHNNLALTKLILEHKIDKVDLIDPLILASEKPTPEFLKLLIATKKIDFETQGRILINLVNRNRIDLVSSVITQLLVEPYFFLEAVLLATQKGHIEILEILISHATLSLEYIFEAYILAVSTGHLESLKTLLAYMPINPEIQAHGLEVAVDHGFVMIVDRLLLIGEISDNVRFRLIKDAISKNSHSLLIRFKPDLLDVKNRDEALIMAATLGSFDCAREIIISGPITKDAVDQAAIKAKCMGFSDILSLLSY